MSARRPKFQLSTHLAEGSRASPQLVWSCRGNESFSQLLEQTHRKRAEVRRLICCWADSFFTECLQSISITFRQPPPHSAAQVWYGRRMGHMAEWRLYCCEGGCWSLFCFFFYHLKMEVWLSLGSLTMHQTLVSAWEFTYWPHAHSTGKNPSLGTGNDTQNALLTHK